MTTALLHGRSRSWVDGRRHWPFLLAGVLATGLIAAGFGIADAYQDQKAVDDQAGLIAPVETSEPTVTPTTPTTPPSPTTANPSAPATKKPTTPAASPKQQQPRDQNGGTKSDPSKPGTTKDGGADQAGSKSGGTKPQNGGSKNR